MPVGASFQLAVCAPADVATPPANKVAYFANSADSNRPYYKDNAGAIHSLTGPAGPIGPTGSHPVVLEFFDESDIIEAPPVNSYHHPNSSVTPGSYTSADITVDAQGHVTAAANGTGGSGGDTLALFLSGAVI